MKSARLPTLAGVYEARRVVAGYLKPTPLYYSKRLSAALDCEIYLKLENLQPTRAFKVRGGINYMNSLRREGSGKVVIAASTGNHAQSIAYAGSVFGIEVKIVMPNGVPKVKTEAIKELGAETIFHGNYYDEARVYAEKLAADRGYVYIHASDEPLLHEGVGTMHLEVFEERPDIDLVINPIGGGSGASGACTVYKTLNPRIKVIGIQAEGASAFFQSWKEGRIKTIDAVATVAEGLATATAYELPFRVLGGLIDDVVLVSDEDMKRAVKTIFLTTGQVAELSGAASTAGAFRQKERLAGKKVVLMVTGGNIQDDQLASILTNVQPF